MSNATRATASEDGESEVLAAAGLPAAEVDPRRAWAQVLADEAERGYDLDKAIRVTVGRPSLGAKGVGDGCLPKLGSRGRR
jgi:hypothetical protein